MECIEEQWVTVPDFPNYAISSFGRAWSEHYKRFLLQTETRGYKYVYLYGEEKPYRLRVHRLVAQAFIPNPFGYSDVNHIDGDKDNNCVWNLEWTTKSENALHAFRTGLKYPVNRRPVRIIETGEVFESLHACAAYIGGTPGNLHHCLSGKIKTHRGYTFEYVNPEDFSCPVQRR